MERPEPAAGVVEHAIEDDPHPAVVGRVEQLAQRVVAAEQRIDREVVVGVVAVVRGRLEDRGQVERVDPEVLEVVEVLDDAEQVAALEAVVGRRRVPRLERTRLVDALARREPVGEDLVEDRVADPGRRVDASSSRRHGRRAPGPGPSSRGRRAASRAGGARARQRRRPWMTARSRRTASSPLRRIGWWTVVSGGSTCWARSMSSKPDDADVAGDTRGRARAGRASRRSPSRRSWPGRRSGRRPSSQARLERGDAALDAGRADDDRARPGWSTPTAANASR